MLCSKETGLKQSLRHIFEQQHPSDSHICPALSTSRGDRSHEAIRLGIAFAPFALCHQNHPRQGPEEVCREHPSHVRASPVFEGLGDLCVAPRAEGVLAARAGAGSPLAFVPYRHGRVTGGIVQAGAGDERHVPQAVLLQVHGDDAWTTNGKGVNLGVTIEAPPPSAPAPGVQPSREGWCVTGCALVASHTDPTLI